MYDKQSGKRRVQDLFQRRGKRLWVAFIFFLGLTLFFHFKETRMELLELNEPASHYVIGQVDFEFPDEEATILLKQEASTRIGAIYRIEKEQLRQRRFDFENELLHNQSWRDEIPLVSYEEMYLAADAWENLLLNTRFTDAKTLQMAHEFLLSSDQYLNFVPSSQDTEVFFPEEYWTYLKEVFLEDSQLLPATSSQEEMMDFILHFFAKKPWHLTHDRTAEETLKRLVETSVGPKYTKVQAGTRIINQGEKVTQRHLAMLEAMKKAVTSSQRLGSVFVFFSNSVLAFLILIILCLYLRFDQPDLWKSSRKLALLAAIFLLTLGLAKGAEVGMLNLFSPMAELFRYPIFVPFATLLIAILLGERAAFFSSVVLSILLAVFLAVDHSSFLLVNFLLSLIVLLSISSVCKRKEVFLICGRCFLTAIALLIVFQWSSSHGKFSSFFLETGGSFLFLLTTSLLVVGFLPIFESVFSVMTDISLMEFMDPNHPLLKQLILEMPGTYQHCLVLGNLAEAAARAIGANGLFCRVATLYHDIGKLQNISYFSENQPGGMDTHGLLTPEESAQLIISHVTAGEELGKKYRLPESFIDVIREHHGTALVYYFYHKEVQQKGSASLVDERLFRYPGPKPHTKESAIIMLADIAEAASRSLGELTEESFSEHIDRLFRDKMEDGQLDECALTFEELKRIKQALIKTLVSLRHVRVKYPEKKGP